MKSKLKKIKDKDHYTVKDLSLREEGLMEIKLAELEMPGLMELRTKYSSIKPLSGARIAGCLNMTIQTAVFIETLLSLGAEVRWCSSNSLSTQDHAAAALAGKGVSVFAWKGQSPEEYIHSLRETLFKNEEWWPNLILDDGADLVMLIHEEYSEFTNKIKGITEETTSGINLYRKWINNNQLKIPVYNVNDAPTKQKFDNNYGCRESLIDGLKRSLDVMISGKISVVSGYGFVGKGCAKLLRDYGSRVIITEIDPIAALQATVDGFEVLKIKEASKVGDIFITATGNIEVITEEYILSMKNGAILCNMGHRDVEFDYSITERFPTEKVKPYVDMITLPSGNKIFALGCGKDVNLACATGHSNFVMSISLTNQTFALLNMHQNKKMSIGIHQLPRIYDELNANYHLKSKGVYIDILNDNQSDYIGVPVSGPFKTDDYHY